MSPGQADSELSVSTTGCADCDILQAEFSKGSSKPQLTSTGKVLLGINAATFALVCGVTTPFILPALRRVCLPYVPATTKQVWDEILLCFHCFQY